MKKNWKQSTETPKLKNAVECDVVGFYETSEKILIKIKKGGYKFGFYEKDYPDKPGFFIGLRGTIIPIENIEKWCYYDEEKKEK